MAFPSFKTKDEIPKGFEGEYQEKDGEWVPKELTELESALEDERTKRKAAETLSKKVAKELKDAETKAKANDAGITDEQLQKVRADIKAEFEAEYAPKIADVEAVKRENRTLKLDNAVQKLAADAGFLPNKLNDLWKLHGDEFDLTDDGKPMVKGKPGIDPKKHIESLKAARPEWVQGTQGSGGGAQGITKPGTTTETVTLNPTERLARAHEKGITA